MPYFLDGKCVRKGTKDNPGEVVKCHTTMEKALAHLRALYVHVEDALMKAIGVGKAESQPNAGDVLESSIHRAFTVAADLLYGMGYMSRDERIKLSGAIGDSLGSMSAALDKLDMQSRSVDASVAASIVGLLGGAHQQPSSIMSVHKDVMTNSDRWITVSTAEMWDRQDEMFTKEAMDYDIARIQRTGEWPELRMFHVRGFKLGKCDSTQRIGTYMVDQGYWLDTPFAQAVKSLVVDNKGKWKVSRGFYSVEATGLCLKCGASLLVHPINYILGVMCKECPAYYAKPTQLSRLKHLKTITFDISITDVPVVANTAVSAYGFGSDS